MKRTLPDYNKPPLIEVVLSVQFEEIKNLSLPRLGLLWDQYRDRFPITRQHQRLAHIIEKFGQNPQQQGGVRIEFSQSPPVLDTRLWFINQDETELIQVQPDRFIRNWRKAGTEMTYPHYEKIRENFVKDLEVFEDFLQKEKLDPIKPNQCEVTYVNHISADKGWENHSQISKVFSLWNQNPKMQTGLVPEETRFDIKHIISNHNNDPCGRLHINLEPAFRRSDNAPIFILRMTARGHLGSEKKQVLTFFDRGHEHIVHSFTDITTEIMHQEWERTQ